MVATRPMLTPCYMHVANTEFVISCWSSCYRTMIENVDIGCIRHTGPVTVHHFKLVVIVNRVIEVFD